MDYQIQHAETRHIAGFHLVGPWDQTVPKGFEQLVMWVDGNHIHPLEWIAVYYDNPDLVPAEKLRCATAVCVPENFTIPANSEGVKATEVAGGHYAVAQARVENYDFETPWRLFFNSLLEDSQYQIAPKPCFEIYLNDGAKEGYWDIQMFVPVEPKLA